MLQRLGKGPQSLVASLGGLVVHGFRVAGLDWYLSVAHIAIRWAQPA